MLMTRITLKRKLDLIEVNTHFMVLMMVLMMRLMKMGQNLLVHMIVVLQRSILYS